MYQTALWVVVSFKHGSNIIWHVYLLNDYALEWVNKPKDLRGIVSLPQSVLVECAHHCKSQFLTRIIIYIFKDFNSPPQILVLSCYKSLWCSLFYRTNPVFGHPTGSTTSTNFNEFSKVSQMNWLHDWR